MLENFRANVLKWQGKPIILTTIISLSKWPFLKLYYETSDVVKTFCLYTREAKPFVYNIPKRQYNLSYVSLY